MAGKFIELADAAKMLGVSEDELNSLRLKGQIHAMRDGTSWKFKTDELERVAEDRGVTLAGDKAADADNLLDIGDLDIDDDSPTEIGSPDAMDDDLLGDDVDLSLEDDDLGLDVDPAAKTGVRVSDDDDDDDDLGLDLATESDLDLAGADSTSDVALIPDDTGSEVSLVADSSPDAVGGTDVGLEVGTGDLEFEGSDLSLGSDVAISDDDDIALGDDEDDLTIGDDEEISLDDDDELVLKSGSDITGGGTGDTGINLGSPSDSGLNLEEEPLDLAGSSVSSLELPEDDDLLDLEDLGDGSAGVQADEDFQLSPSADQLDDEEDSGSQVIALEDSEAFAEMGDDALGDEAVLGDIEEGDELETALEETEGGSVTQPALPAGAMLAAAPETPYSIWNVLSLLGIVIVLGLTGMLMTDLVRNMWTWEDPYTASTPVMDLAVRMFGLDP